MLHTGMYTNLFRLGDSPELSSEISVARSDVVRAFVAFRLALSNESTHMVPQNLYRVSSQFTPLCCHMKQADSIYLCCTVSIHSPFLVPQGLRVRLLGTSY